LDRTDFPLVSTWLARPHVARWWGTPRDLAGVEAEYGPCVDGADPTRLFLGLAGAHPLGFVQAYRLADNLDYARAVDVAEGAGIDLLIGDEDRCGHGWGPRLIAAALEVVWNLYPEVQRAMAGPSVDNTRSVRAFEKAGFQRARRVRVPGEDDDELILVCPRPTAG